MAAEQENVPHQQGDHTGGKDAGVEREKTRQSVMPVIRPADDESLKRRADAGNDAQDVRCHFGGPVAFLIPGQQITGERKRQHELEQTEPEPEIDFSRGPVSAVDDHLHKVEHQQHVHHGSGEMMDAAQQPTAVHFVLNVVDALPRRLRTRAVGHP